MANKKSKSVPQEYKLDSIESKFTNFIPWAYEDGWNSEGTPASFKFNDGVLVEYDEENIDDVDDFVSYYEEMTGYRSNDSLSAEELFEEGQDSGSAYLFTYTLDFSGHPDLKKKSGNFLVVIRELQAGGDGPIAGTIQRSKGLDEKWLLKWIDNSIDNNLLVVRV